MRAIIILCLVALSGHAQPVFDVVVYGGTSAGVVCAVKAAQLGRSVVLVNPTHHVGGLTASGLGATDIGNKRAIGGLSRSFYRRIRERYSNDAEWKYQRRDQFRGWRDEDALWYFEPHVAQETFAAMLAESKVQVESGERLDLEYGCVMDGTRIVALVTESKRHWRGRMFVDATYEGDLLAKAGVSYHVGREPCARYGETLNGVQTLRSVKHQFVKDVDPFVVRNDPRSGLLFGIQGRKAGRERSGDGKVQAYNFRLCLTDVPENRVPFPKPDGYDASWYELLIRNFEAGDLRIPFHSIAMPNRKTDTNNNHAVSTDFIGMSWAWPEGDYATRARLFDLHRRWQQGLFWTMANHPRVPESVRRRVSRWGLSKDEFIQTGNWPHELYVREGRRMIAATVMTELHCLGVHRCDDPVGLAAYNMDSHNVQRWVDSDGRVRNEGDIQVPPTSPYPISYRSIVPADGECSNLLVPVCLSASHIAYGSIRMEPVFMILGESAATAADLAIRGATSVQGVRYEALRARLLAAGQVLEWKGTKPVRQRSIDPENLEGIVVDDRDAELEGAWAPSASVGPFVGIGYRHDGNLGKGDANASFELRVTTPGRYEIRLAYSANPNRATNVPVTIRTASGNVTRTVNQRTAAPIDRTWVSLGTHTLDASARVIVSNRATDGYVIVDAVQALKR